VHEVNTVAARLDRGRWLPARARRRRIPGSELASPAPAQRMVVVSRLIKVENTVTYIPGSAYVAPFPYYNTFYGYYGAVYPAVYSPDYLREEKKVRIETNLYVISSQEGELVWTGVTDTFNPSNVQKAINGLVKLVVKQMQSDEALE